MDGNTATQSADLAIRILTGFVDIQSIPMLAVPLGLFVYSFTNSMSYNKDNSVFHSSIEDQLDKKGFQDVVVPLYGAISANLLTEALAKVTSVSCRDKEAFLNTYEAEKETLLKTRDFTFLEASIDFQNAIRDIVKSRKNHIVFDELKKNSRTLLIVGTVTGFLTFLCGISVVFFQKVIYTQPALNISLGAWVISIAITAILLGKYWINKTTLDNLV